MDCQMIDLVTIREVKSQAIIAYLVDGKELCDKKIEELFVQISEPDG